MSERDVSRRMTSEMFVPRVRPKEHVTFKTLTQPKVTWQKSPDTWNALKKRPAAQTLSHPPVSEWSSWQELLPSFKRLSQILLYYVMQLMLCLYEEYNCLKNKKCSLLIINCCICDRSRKTKFSNCANTRPFSFLLASNSHLAPLYPPCIPTLMLAQGPLCLS